MFKDTPIVTLIDNIPGPLTSFGVKVTETAAVVIARKVDKA
jgi:hypothetical protein